MRKILGFLHLIAGLSSGLVIVIIALTGCINSFDEELRELMNSNLMHVEKEKGKVLSFDEIVKIVQEKNPEDKVRFIRFSPDETKSVEVSLPKKVSVYVNQYNGKILGKINKHKDFLGTVQRIHRNLLLDDLGEWIVGISTLIFLGMILTGIILWWPRNTRMVKQSLLIQKNTFGVKKWYDWHSILGFYASWFILITVLTGLVWSFDWAEEALFAATGSKKEERQEWGSSQKDNKQNILPIHMAFFFAYRDNKVGDQFGECTVFLPEDNKGAYGVSFRSKEKSFFRQQDIYFIDQFSGKQLGEKKFESLSKGEKFRMSNLNIHSGRSFGLIGRWIIFSASLVCASLPITGFLLWWTKRKIKKKQIESYN